MYGLKPVALGALARYLLKSPVETTEIEKAAFITYFFDVGIVTHQQFTGMSDPDLGQKLKVGFAGSGFKIPAKRVGNQPRNAGYLLQVYLLVEIIERKFINIIDPVVLGVQKDILVTN
jgi:hypothetical protein